MNHFCVLYQTEKTQKDKLPPVDELFVTDCLARYVARFGKQPNRIYAGILISKNFGIEYIVDESIATYLLYIGHTEDTDKIR